MTAQAHQAVPPTGGRLGRWPLATTFLFAVSGLILLAQALFARGWQTWWLLSPDRASLHGALTYAFFHADLLHWAMNMVFLLAIGPRLEKAIGAVGMLSFFLLGAVVAGLLHISMVYLFMPSQAAQPLLGASGGIMALLGAYTVRYYNRRITPVAVPVGWLLFAWLLSEGFFGWRAIAAGHGTVAHWAHVGGYLAGMSLAVLTGLHKAGRREDAFTQRSLDQQTRRLAEYLRDHPDDAASRVAYAESLVQLGDMERATRAYRKALQTWLAHGRRKEAAEAYLAMCAAHLEAGALFDVKAARALEDSGYTREALEVYDRLSGAPGPEAENANLRAAHLAERLGNEEDARQRYQAFLLMFPDSQFAPQARRRLSRLSAPAGGGA